MYYRAKRTNETKVCVCVCAWTEGEDKGWCVRNRKIIKANCFLFFNESKRFYAEVPFSLMKKYLFSQ